MPSQLHHVVMRSHSASTFIQFLTDVVGMEIQSQFRVPGEVLETTLGWPPSEGADVTMLGSGDAGLIEVLVYYSFAKSVDEADTYVAVEVYRDSAAVAAHGETEWVRDSVPQSLRLIEGMPRIMQYVSPGTAPVVSQFDDLT